LDKIRETPEISISYFRDASQKSIPAAIVFKIAMGVSTEEWVQVPWQTIHNLHESTPRRIKAVIAAKVGPSPN
jgi:hypothetical protein